jgi:hypothetical protein
MHHALVLRQSENGQQPLKCQTGAILTNADIKARVFCPIAIRNA